MEQKRKWKRTVVGSICKSRDAGKPDYIKITQDVKLSKGSYLSLESKNFQAQSLEAAVADGKISEENAEKAFERINRIPDWVRFEVVQLSTEE